MAFNSSGGDRRLIAEINVTPFVDVMLVLLVIFMVTAPMMMQGIDVSLPQVDTQSIRSENERLVISMTAEGDIFLEEYKVTAQELGVKVKGIMEARGIKEVFLRADKSIPYGRIAEIMGNVRQAGVTNLGLVTEPERVKPPAGP